MHSKKLVLVDGSSYLFRAYHALPPLTTKNKEPTGAMLGCLNMVQKLLTQEQPDYMAVVFDSKEKTIRHEWYPDYKANRAVMPEDLGAQIAPLQTMIKALGIALVVIPGVEADDIIGTLALMGQAQCKVLISTGDKDFAQLVRPGISLVNTMTGEQLDPLGVQQKFGVLPERIVDYLTLVGDTSDNVPGVPKVGPKTAVKWLNHYGSLDHLIIQANEISGKVGEYLRQALGWLPQAKRLVTIYTNIPLEVSLTDLVLKPKDHELLRELWTRYEFKSWLSQLATKTEKPPKAVKVIKPIDTYEKLQSFLNTKELAISLRYSDDGILEAIHFCDATLLDLSLEMVSMDEAMLRLLRERLGDPHCSLVGYHLKQSLHALAAHRIYPGGPLHDVMIASYVLNSTQSHDYAAIAKATLELAMEEVDHPIPSQMMRIYHKQKQDLATVPGLLSLYEDLECPLIRILWALENHGMLIDTALLIEQSKRLGDRINQLTDEAYLLAKEAFNLSSPKQLQVILFEKLGLPVLDKTPTGQPSTAESVLHELAIQYELPRLILQHRSLTKLKSTYTDRLPQQVDPKTHRVHTTFQQAVTATGRLSSQDPNLQNIPTRTEEGSAIRKAFIAPKGYSLLSADYSQIELRIMAHLSQDLGLLKAFQAGVDVHRFTASELFEVPLASVTSEQRRRAKTINFGLIYGMSAFGLAKQLEVSREEAEQFMNAYFTRYPNVKTFMQTARETAHQQGYVETLLGRRVYLPDIHSKRFHLRQAAERAAINGPMQGTAADIIKLAMIKVQQWCTPFGDRLTMILQVHDELVFEVANDLLEQAKQSIPQLMTGVIPLLVPLEVEVGVGVHWQAAH